MKVIGTAIAATGVFVALTSFAMAQDAAKGKSTFNQCLACHALDHSVVGPALKGVVGRKAGTFAGFQYSDLMKAAGDAGLVWNTDELVEYLKNPTQYLQAFVKGKGKDASGSSKMVFMLANETQRKNVVAYLADQK